MNRKCECGHDIGYHEGLGCLHTEWIGGHHVCCSCTEYRPVTDDTELEAAGQLSALTEEE